jgi:hypothetical protein
MRLAKDEQLPEIVKSHNSFFLNAKRVGLFNTGVYLENDDLYTILATGSIDMAPRGPLHIYTPEDGWPVMARIGKDGYAFQPIHRGYNSGTRNSYTNGELFIGYRTGQVDSGGNPLNPEFYLDDVGSFTVDVIVWKEENYVQIYDFFKGMHDRDPQNKAVVDALQYAENNKKYQIARAQVVKKVDETKKMIEELKEEKEQIHTGSQADTSTQTTASSTDTSTAKETINVLETKLSELMAKVAELDEMKIQLEQRERKQNNFHRR